MAFSRYTNSPILGLGTQYGTSDAIRIVRSAIKNGEIQTTKIYIKGSERLDTLAGELYGDGRYWWILAAASDIGWGLQLAPGTIILVPNLGDISALLG